MNISKVNLLIGFILLFFFSSCYKSELVATYTLTPEELQYLSYSEGQQVVYTNSVNGELLAFTAEPATSEMIKIPEGINTNMYYLFEQRIQFLIASDAALRFNLESDRKYQTKAKMEFSWDTGIENYPRTIGSSFYIPIDSTDRFFNLTYYDSLMVQQDLYRDVYRGIFSLFASPGDTTPIPESAVYPLSYYYCLPYGMIRFDMSDSTSWELICE